MLKVTKISSVLIFCTAMEIVAMESGTQSLSKHQFLLENDTLENIINTLSPRDFPKNKDNASKPKINNQEAYLNDNCEVRVTMKDGNEALQNWYSNGEGYVVTKKAGEEDRSKKEKDEKDINFFSDLEQNCMTNFKVRKKQETEVMDPAVKPRSDK